MESGMQMQKKPAGGLAPPVIELLRRNAVAGAFLPTIQRHLELQQEVRLLLPVSLLDGIEICGLENGTLIVEVPSASVASKFRQMLPRLREGLEGRGWKVNAIRLRIQPASRKNNSPSKSLGYRSPVKQAGLSRSAIGHLAQLAQDLEPSPLQDAVARLIERHRGR